MGAGNIFNLLLVMWADTKCWINRNLHWISDQLSPAFLGIKSSGHIVVCFKGDLAPVQRECPRALMRATHHMCCWIIIIPSFIFFTIYLSRLLDQRRKFPNFPLPFHFHPGCPFIYLHPQLTAAPTGRHLNHVESWVTITDSRAIFREDPA